MKNKFCTIPSSFYLIVVLMKLSFGSIILNEESITVDEIVY